MTKPTTQIKCCDCERKRDPFKAVVRHANGKVDWTCRQCWLKYGYAEYLPQTAMGPQ